jgi:hypothetical protein
LISCDYYSVAKRTSNKRRAPVWKATEKDTYLAKEEKVPQVKKTQLENNRAKRRRYIQKLVMRIFWGWLLFPLRSTWTRESLGKSQEESSRQ